MPGDTRLKTEYTQFWATMKRDASPKTGYTREKQGYTQFSGDHGGRRYVENRLYAGKTVVYTVFERKCRDKETRCPPVHLSTL